MYISSKHYAWCVCDTVDWIMSAVPSTMAYLHGNAVLLLLNSPSSAHDSRMQSVILSFRTLRVHQHATSLTLSPHRNTYNIKTPILSHQQELPWKEWCSPEEGCNHAIKRFSTDSDFQARYRICQTVRNPAWNESIWSRITAALSEGSLTALILFLENKQK